MFLKIKYLQKKPPENIEGQQLNIKWKKEKPFFYTAGINKSEIKVDSTSGAISGSSATIVTV